MQITDFSTERLNKGYHVQSRALDIYRSVLRKLSNDNMEGSFIVSWKQCNTYESLSKFHLEDTGHIVINKAKLHPLESDRKLVPCHICSFLENSFDSLKVEQQSSTISTVLPHGICSFDFGCSDGGILTNVECLRCLCLKMIKEGTMQNLIHFKWQCQRRRLLFRLLLKIAKSLEVTCEKQDAHEVHGVFCQCISMLFDGKPCFDANFHGYDLNLLKLMEDNNTGDIFSAERAALLYNMSWFFLKDFHPEHMRCTTSFHGY
ncbi:uncharacterized protein LOC110036586 [Phalaenopsis equestris]|uniref:uncharacterized protein LOC110036586 n=1 Tax=Phalaenopsis equestris TaxID=78828 RepID=UPI0009E3910F|nr:uncharacterized protein LOC110036586 [Phalaenopsis equestris]